MELDGQKGIEILEATSVEPVMNRILDDVRQHNKKLKHITSFDADDEKQTTSRFDTLWFQYGYMQVPMRVSGPARHIYIDQDGKTVTQEVVFEETVLTSNGFIIERSDEESIEIKHHFIYMDPESGMLSQYCAGIDDILVDCLYPSPARAELWLQYFYPSIIEQLDCMLFMDDPVIGEGPLDEAASLYKLREFRIKMEDTALDDTEMLKNSIASYVNGLVRFDASVPYGVTIDGDTLYHDEHGREQYKNENSTNLVFFGKLVLMPRDKEAQKNDLTFWIEMRVISNHTTIPDRGICAPLEGIKNVESVRKNAQLFYGSNN